MKWKRKPHILPKSRMKLVSLAAVFVSSHNGAELCGRRQKRLLGRLGWSRPKTPLKTPSHPCLKLREGRGGGGGKFLVYFVQPTLFLSWCQHLTLDVIGSLRTRTVTSSKSRLSVLLENIQLNNLRNQPTYRDTTTRFPAKWRLRNGCGNSILIQIWLLLSTNQKHCSGLGSDRSSVWIRISACRFSNVTSRGNQ